LYFKNIWEIFELIWNAAAKGSEVPVSIAGEKKPVQKGMSEVHSY
jgi:hypothetical protein